MANLIIFADMTAREFLIVFISCIFLTVNAVAQDSQRHRKAENDFLTMVTNYTAARDYTLARKQLGSLVASDPLNDAAWYYLGMCNLRLGNNKEAIDNLKKAVSIDTSNYWYRERLAVAYQADGQDELTIDTYERLLKAFPKKTDLYYNLVNLYLRHGQLDKAMDELDNIEGAFGKSEQLAGMRYQILLNQNKPQEAFKALESFNEDYSSPDILVTMGDYKMAEYEDSLALTYYEEALGLSSDYIPALLGKAEVYRQRRDYPGFFQIIRGFISNPDQHPAAKAQYLSALTTRSDPAFVHSFMPQIDTLFEQCISLHPVDSTVLQAAGAYYYGTSRKDKAVSAFRKNMDLYPRSKMARMTYIQLLGSLKDWEGIISTADEASKYFGDDVDFEEMKVAAYYNLEDWDKIIATEEKIISIAGADTTVTIPAWSNIGDAYHQAGDHKKAYKAYEKVLKISPNHVPTLNNYAYYLSEENKKLKKAEAMSKKTVTAEPDNPTYLDTYGWILHLQGRSAEAKTYFKHAMLYGGKESAVILDHYAEVLYKLGEYDLAKVYWNQAVSKNQDGKIADLEQRIKARLERIKK